MKIKKKSAATESVEVIRDERNLALKYRPRTLDEVVGADHAVQQLRTVIADAKKGKFPTCILLSGESGCGKTTLARVVARTINCETYVGCGKCKSCQQMDNLTHPDFKDVNVGSVRGIDDIRELMSTSNYLPMVGRVRFIFLDEVHNLTPQAMQTTLKHTEEPPANTVFILATTNPEKLPKAQRGRTLRLPLGLIPVEAMMAHLHKVSKAEGLNMCTMPTGEKADDKEARIANGKKLLREIADLSGGQMRDALMILDSILKVNTNGKFTSGKQLFAAFMQSFDVTVDDAAIKTLLQCYAAKYVKAIRAVYDVENSSRALMQKMRYINDNMLREALTAKPRWYDYAFKKLKEVLKQQPDIKPTVAHFLIVQSRLNEVERHMNSVPTPEYMLLSDTIYSVCKDIAAMNGRVSERHQASR